MARSTLIQGGPAFFTPEGYTPPIQPEQAFMPTDVMRDPIADMFAAQPPLIRGPSLNIYRRHASYERRTANGFSYAYARAYARTHA